MKMTEKQLKDLAKEVRINIVESIGNLGVGHIGGCLSIVEVLVSLYYEHMNIDPKNPKMEGRDRLIVSKGHAGPAVYSILSQKGYFSKELLLSLNRGGTNLPSHCDMNRTVGIDMTTGSLGQGFSCAVGVSIGSKIRKDNATIYTIIGDGESQEGQIWEAAMYASQKKLNNLIAFTDYNKMQIDGMVEEINGLNPLDKKWEAFGWNVYSVNGHSFKEIDKAITKAKKQKEKPTMILLNTIKGKGVRFVEEKGTGKHNMTITMEEMEQAIAEIKGE